MENYVRDSAQSLTQFFSVTYRVPHTVSVQFFTLFLAQLYTHTSHIVSGKRNVRNCEKLSEEMHAELCNGLCQGFVWKSVRSFEGICVKVCGKLCRICVKICVWNCLWHCVDCW